MPKFYSTHAIKGFFLPIISAVTLTFATPSFAENWRTNVKDIFLPSHLVAVDKEQQKFYFYEKKSPLRLKYEFACTTGQKAGDKQAINDLKTPEGIYFVGYKIASGLDFREYGGVAYTLNYPNPVDKLRGKTGHGIWIHSKGFGLVPTKGCVAIGLQEIDTVGPNLTPGTAVIVANGMTQPQVTKEDKSTAQYLHNLMQAWTAAWAQRSRKMFDFYDQDAYTKATEDFTAFRLNKERIFKMVNDIRLFNREIHVLEGPGYWVTWSEQCYTASNHTSEGIRRLYWQRGDDKRYRIVGMEWLPRDLGMLAEYKKGKLVAQATSVKVDDSSEAPSLPNLSMPEDAPTETALPKGRQQLVAVSDPLVPSQRPNNTLKEFNWMEGSTAKPTPTQEPPQPIVKTPDDLKKEAIAKTQEFTKLLAAHDQAVVDLFSQPKFNRVPGVFKQRSLRSTLHEIERLQSLPDLDLISAEPTAEIAKNLIVSHQDVLLKTQKSPMEGEFRIYWLEEDSKLQIVGLNFLPKVTGLTATWLEKITAEVGKEIEAWRVAWEKGDLENYVSFYAENALQQGRRGIKLIKRQKEDLWARIKPVRIIFNGLRLQPTPTGLKVDMTQTYSDSTGKEEYGLKTLLLQFEENKWKIVQEDWQYLPKPRASL
ncbi:MAG: L,D-transpeptidase family protein [Desulfovibrionaceae bacterium]|nr:L,D-transpeptidase family protein [Desulfovibrionaceae bacterium]